MISESLFVLAKRIYGFRYLNWHYRSKYQDLIDFSNHAFYDGRLQVAPNVIRKPKDPPIRWICCNGTWNEQTNLIGTKKDATNITKSLTNGANNDVDLVNDIFGVSKRKRKKRYDDDWGF